MSLNLITEMKYQLIYLSYSNKIIININLHHGHVFTIKKIAIIRRWREKRRKTYCSVATRMIYKYNKWLQQKSEDYAGRVWITVFVLVKTYHQCFISAFLFVIYFQRTDRLTSYMAGGQAFSFVPSCWHIM